MQNDVHAKFDTRRLFAHSSAEGQKFLSVPRESDFNMCIYAIISLYYNYFEACYGPIFKCDVEKSYQTQLLFKAKYFDIY